MVKSFFINNFFWWANEKKQPAIQVEAKIRVFEEKYLESLLRKFKITSVLEAKYFVNVIFNEEILTKLKAEDIFIASTKISDKFEFEYKNRQLLIKVKKEPNDKNWIYLYSELLSALVKKIV